MWLANAVRIQLKDVTVQRIGYRIHFRSSLWLALSSAIVHRRTGIEDTNER
jgi:hypothetical protein